MDQESGNWTEAHQKLSSGGQSVRETIIVIRLEENDESSTTGDEQKVKGCAKEDGFSCCVDVNCGDQDGKLGKDSQNDSQRVCRICHLNAKEEGNENLKDLIELGCGCKGEVGFSHLRCAEAWFKLKGSRLCEICGEIAKNVTGVGNISFMEEWIEGRSSGDGGGSGERGRCCRERQPFCNFLMGCLVIAFVLPWFFRVNA